MDTTKTGMIVALLGLTLLAACSAPQAENTPVNLDPAQFRGHIANDDVFVIDVHVPEQAHIAGTDAVIPYNELAARAAELPADKSTPIALYCRSGTMSAEAIQTLKGMGYTDVVHLEGGMNAWTAAGYSAQ